MKIRTINPFRDANAFWLGLDEPGYRRKVFKIVDRELVNSEFMVAGLTIFEPGESSSVHNHPESEEINYVVRGSGTVLSEARRRSSAPTPSCSSRKASSTVT